MVKKTTAHCQCIMGTPQKGAGIKTGTSVQCGVVI